MQKKENQVQFKIELIVWGVRRPRREDRLVYVDKNTTDFNDRGNRSLMTFSEALLTICHFNADLLFYCYCSDPF